MGGWFSLETLWAVVALVFPGIELQALRTSFADVVFIVVDGFVSWTDAC